MMKGKEEGSHEWVVVTIDFNEILVDKCKKTDYDDWTPMVGQEMDTKEEFKGCQMGEKLTYKVSDFNFDAKWVETP